MKLKNAYSHIKSIIGHHSIYLGKCFRLANQFDKLARSRCQKNFLISCRREKLFPKPLENKYDLPTPVKNNGRVISALLKFKFVLLLELISSLFKKIVYHLKEIECLTNEIFSEELNNTASDLWDCYMKVYNRTYSELSFSHNKKLSYLRRKKKHQTYECKSFYDNKKKYVLHKRTFKANSKYSQKLEGNDSAVTIKDVEHALKPVGNDRVVIAKDVELNNTAINVLSKGPNFSIAPSDFKDQSSIIHNIEIGLNKMAIQARTIFNSSKFETDHFATTTPLETNHLAKVLRKAPFDRYPYYQTTTNHDFEISLNSVSKEILDVSKAHVKTIKENISREEKNVLKDLKFNDKIIIKKTDKSKALSVQSKGDYISKMFDEHLSDSNTYEKLPKRSNPIPFIENKIKILWDNISKRNNLSKTVSAIIKPTNTKAGEMYGLLKDHKKVDEFQRFPLRPVVSGPDTPTEKLSWLFDQILHLLLEKVDSHIGSEDEFLSILEKNKAYINENTIICSFDVVALYPSIDIDKAIQVVTDLCAENFDLISNYGIELAEIKEGLSIILKNNIIRFGNDLYKQVKGVAMGNRLAPVIAILYMHHVEKIALEKSEKKPKLYLRYIDDVFCIWNDGSDSLQDFHDCLNSADDNIKFTIENPSETGWLPFLRFHLKVNNGILERKVYRKTACKDIYLSKDSHHPREVKENTIINEFKNIDKICSNEDHYKESSNIFKSILIQNNYDIKVIDTLERKARSIYNYLRKIFVDGKENHLDDNEITNFLKSRSLNIIRSKGDGHCLLHSVVQLTGIHIVNLKEMIRIEVSKNIDHYASISSAEVIKKELDDYLINKRFNLDVVDLMPIIISRALCHTVYIFQAADNKSFITKIGNYEEKPILLRRLNQNHFDAISTKHAWKKPSKVKSKFENYSILKLPFISNEHSKVIKSILHKNKDLKILPVFTPGIKLSQILTRTTLEQKTCTSSQCIFKNTSICMTKNVVYQLTCSMCGEIYVGETKRSLHQRLLEHNRAIQLGDISSAISEHYMKHHQNMPIPNQPFQATILERCTNNTRIISEGIWIKKLKPKINRDSGLSLLKI